MNRAQENNRRVAEKNKDRCNALLTFIWEKREDSGTNDRLVDVVSMQAACTERRNE
jgi:hypothetical protein